MNEACHAGLHDMHVVKLDVSLVKEISTRMKNVGLMKDLRNGYQRKRKVETRFGTFFGAIGRFVISALYVENPLARKYGTLATNLLTKFATLTPTVDTGKRFFTALNALLFAFKAIRDMQKAFEHTSIPNIITVKENSYFVSSVRSQLFDLSLFLIFLTIWHLTKRLK